MRDRAKLIEWLKDLINMECYTICLTLIQVRFHLCIDREKSNHLFIYSSIQFKVQHLQCQKNNKQNESSTNLLFHHRKCFVDNK